MSGEEAGALSTWLHTLHQQRCSGSPVEAPACILLTAGPAAGKTSLMSQIVMHSLDGELVPILVKIQRLQLLLLEEDALPGFLAASQTSDKEQLDRLQQEHESHLQKRQGEQIEDLERSKTRELEQVTQREAAVKERRKQRQTALDEELSRQQMQLRKKQQQELAALVELLQQQEGATETEDDSHEDLHHAEKEKLAREHDQQLKDLDAECQKSREELSLELGQEQEQADDQRVRLERRHEDARDDLQRKQATHREDLLVGHQSERAELNHKHENERSELAENCAFRNSWNWLDAYLRLEYSENIAVYKMLRQALMARRALILLDGLDEGGTARDEIERHVTEVLARQGHIMLITSRPAGVPEQLFKSFVWLSLKPLTESQQAQAVRQRVKRQAPDLIRYLNNKVPKDENGLRVTANPLMLRCSEHPLRTASLSAQNSRARALSGCSSYAPCNTVW
eukprot:340101-Prymnesium_polylepis.1